MTQAAPWSATQYTAFEDERTRPARDLLAAIPPTQARHCIDLGCGPGNSTRLLAERFPEAEVTGLDSDTDMLATARTRMPGTPFVQSDIATWDDPARYDIVFSNAALQWLPDHDTLFPRLARHLAPGGSLAIQMPDNLDEPAHVLMRDLAADGPWAAKLAGAATARSERGTPARYHALLSPHAARVDVWRTTYHHLLAGGPPAIVEWFKGSGLRPFLAPLDPAERADYLARYTEAVALAYPPLPGGAVLLPFPRLFIVATAGRPA